MIVILNTLIFISIVTVILAAITGVILSRYSSSRSFLASKQAYMAAQSGLEETLYRMKNGISMPSALDLHLSTGSSSIIVSDITAGKKISVTGKSDVYERKLEMNLSLGTGIAFHYGIQSGLGGFELKNSSSVTGNVFSGGPIKGVGNMIYGDVISAGATGLISGIHATGTAFSNKIENSTIDRDAYYKTLTGTTVVGTKYPNSPDQPIAPLPITDAQIHAWEDEAALLPEAQCNNGSYDINAATEIGPLVIPCDLNIRGTAGGYTINVKGHIWVKGNITITQKAKIAMDSSLGSQNVAIIADNPNDHMSSSIINLGNSSTFQGSGATGSWVFMISQNASGESGGSTNAISVGQSSSALVGYAIHGLITLAQSVSLKEVTAYKIVLTQSSNVTYDKGLPNALFSAGPGGGYDIIDWLEL